MDTCRMLARSSGGKCALTLPVAFVFVLLAWASEPSAAQAPEDSLFLPREYSAEPCQVVWIDPNKREAVKVRLKEGDIVHFSYPGQTRKRILCDRENALDVQLGGAGSVEYQISPAPSSLSGYGAPPPASPYKVSNEVSSQIFWRQVGADQLLTPLFFAAVPTNNTVNLETSQGSKEFRVSRVAGVQDVAFVLTNHEMLILIRIGFSRTDGWGCMEVRIHNINTGNYWLRSQIEWGGTWTGGEQFMPMPEEEALKLPGQVTQSRVKVDWTEQSTSETRETTVGVRLPLLGGVGAEHTRSTTKVNRFGYGEAESNGTISLAPEAREVIQRAFRQAPNGVGPNASLRGLLFFNPPSRRSSTCSVSVGLSRGSEIGTAKLASLREVFGNQAGGGKPAERPTSGVGDSYLTRGNERQTKGDLDGAIADFTKAIEADPKSGAAYFARGTVRKAKGDFAGALDDFTYALILDPNNPDAYTERGNVRQAMGDGAGAVADWTKALQVAPPNWPHRTTIENAIRHATGQRKR